MLIAVTDKSEITECQQLLVKALVKHLPNRESLTIGHPGGNFSGKVYYNNDLWYSTHKITNTPVHRYWNGFGLGKRDGHQLIIAEINPPLQGYTKRVSGLFARDKKTGDYALLHRGRIGGGRKGIGKNAFVDWFRGAWVEVASPHVTDEAILVARLSSGDILNQILAFIREVAKFKEEAASGRLTRGPRKKKGFSPEFSGKKKIRKSVDLEYECLHGLVVNKLEERVRQALGNTVNIFNTRSIDLGVEIKNKLAHLYEVKSSASLQTIYTAIGQLMIHSSGEPKVAKTIVIPTGQLDSYIRKLLGQFGFILLEYRINGGKVTFHG